MTYRDNVINVDRACRPLPSRPKFEPDEDIQPVTEFFGVAAAYKVDVNDDIVSFNQYALGSPPRTPGANDQHIGQLWFHVRDLPRVIDALQRARGMVPMVAIDGLAERGA